MITKIDYTRALITVQNYQTQTNRPIMESEEIGEDEFEQLIPVKHKWDLQIDDVIFLCRDHQESPRRFVQVVCRGYSGRDSFWGDTATGKTGWCDMDLYKIVGQQHIIITAEEIPSNMPKMKNPPPPPPPRQSAREFKEGEQPKKQS